MYGCVTRTSVSVRDLAVGGSEEMVGILGYGEYVAAFVEGMGIRWNDLPLGEGGLLWCEGLGK